jgi:hypothetical protein
MGQYQKLYQRLISITEELIAKISSRPLTQKIESLCKVEMKSSIFLLNEAQTELFSIMQSNWIVGLLWVLKWQTKELQKFKSPYNHPFFQANELIGKKINSELQLWENCLNFIDKFTIEQPAQLEIYDFHTAIDGWQTTTYDRIIAGHETIIQKWGKNELIKQLEVEIRKLKKMENPHNPDDPREKNLYNFINTAIVIATPNHSDNNRLRRERKNFREDCWGSYVKAHRDWYQHFRDRDESIQVPYVEDGKLKLSLGGRQTETLWPQPSEKFLKRSRKKNR